MGVQDIITAIPSIASGGRASKDLLRTEMVAGIVGFIAADTPVNTGVLQIDPADAELGGVRQAYVYGQVGTFVYDETDETTAHDGVFCLVLIGGRRYKVVGIPKIGFVLSASVTTPPDPEDEEPESRPSFGDAYLNLGGSWPHATNTIEVWSSLEGGSWQAIAPAYGPPLYVVDVDGYYHWAGDDGWVLGVGLGAYPASTIPLSAAIGFGDFVIVENQTTNSPPVAGQNVAFIIGNSASGAWAGHAGKVAIRESAGVSDDYVIYPHKTGRLVYDKAQNRNYQYNGSSWQTASGRTRTKITTFTASGTFTKEARCVEVVVKLVAAGGNATTIRNGGSVSFGAHLSASGGIGGSPHTGGSGSGGDENFTGQTGGSTGSYYRTMSDAGFGMYGSGNQTDGGNGFGGAGGHAKKRIPAASLLTNETVTFSAGGMNNGFVEVIETIED